MIAGHTGSVSGTIKLKPKPVPLHNTFPDGTVEYATPTSNIPASAPIQSHSHSAPHSLILNVRNEKERYQHQFLPIPSPLPRRLQAKCRPDQSFHERTSTRGPGEGTTPQQGGPEWRRRRCPQCRDYQSARVRVVPLTGEGGAVRRILYLNRSKKLR